MTTKRSLINSSVTDLQLLVIVFVKDQAYLHVLSASTGPITNSDFMCRHGGNNSVLHSTSFFSH